MLVRKESPIAVSTDFTDDLGLCICHEVSKTLTVSLRGDLILESSPDCHWTEKSWGKPLTGISLNFLFPFQSWKYSRLESPPVEQYLQHDNLASAMNWNWETSSRPIMLKREKGQMRVQTGPGPLEPAGEGHLHQTPLAPTHIQTTTSQAHSRASRSPLKVALQSHLEGTHISLRLNESESRSLR